MISVMIECRTNELFKFLPSESSEQIFNRKFCSQVPNTLENRRVGLFNWSVCVCFILISDYILSYKPDESIKSNRNIVTNKETK